MSFIVIQLRIYSEQFFRATKTKNGNYSNSVNTMADENADWNRFIRRFNARMEAQNARIMNAQIAHTHEISQLCSMQNRLIRDVIQLSNRVMQLERIAAYRTKHSDDSDPLKRLDENDQNSVQN